jgi:hypothetical protein
MNYQAIFNEAHAAGMAAGEAAVPQPMYIQGYAPVMDGVCGFAWVHLPDARAPFAKWARDNNKGHKSYRNGFDLSVDGFNQSMQRKEAYARAFANVLKQHGVDAYMQSRID